MASTPEQKMAAFNSAIALMGEFNTRYLIYQSAYNTYNNGPVAGNDVQHAALIAASDSLKEVTDYIGVIVASMPNHLADQPELPEPPY